MQKGFVIGWVLVLVVILIALGGGYYYWQQKNNPKSQTEVIVSPPITPTPLPTESSTSSSAQMADWKTYTNVKYHYLLEYPPTLTYYETTDKGNVDFFIPGQDKDSSSADGFKQHIAVYFRGDNAPQATAKKELNDKFHTFEDFQTNTIQGVKVTSSLTPDFSFDYYITSKNGTNSTLKFFYIIASDPKKITDQEKNLMLSTAQGMLSSFKFTK